jgi:PIN domain nuclease of toxin-antitoxin system
MLLDTHVLLWWFLAPNRLSRRAKSFFGDEESTLLVSAASTWEIAIKVSLGKLNALPMITNFAAYLAKRNFIEQPISIEHSVRAGLLPRHHNDPFDRVLIAQAQALNIPIISSDKQFDRYDVQRVW